MSDVLEYAQPNDALSDFMLWLYKPVASTEGKLRAASLLFHSFAMHGIGLPARRLVDAIREQFGVLNTVWGVKCIADTLSWEFYFYDYRRSERERSMTRLLEVMKPFAACKVAVDEDRPYFMFSIDIDQQLLTGAREIDEMHMYIGNTGSTISSGICYSLQQHATRLENLYYFFDPRTQLEKIHSKVRCSAYLQDSAVDINQVIWPELRDCHVIIVANKQRNDGIYFSRISVHQLIAFLERLRYPQELRQFIKDNRSRLDHQLYDVGFDYRMEGDQLVVLKSGYYGLF